MHRFAYRCAVLLLLTGLWGSAAAAPPPGSIVAAQAFDQAVSLSRGRALDLSGEPLVLSNSPGFPNQPGILCKVDNVLSATAAPGGR